MMPRTLRILVPLVTLGSLLAGSLGLGRVSQATAATAHSPKVITILIQYPYVDPKKYLNDKTKKADMGSYRAAQMTDAVFKEFLKSHPGYTINALNWGWSDPLRQKILLNIAAGNVPDVIVGEDFFPEFAREGILEPVDLGPLRNELAQGPLSVGTYDGKVYAVPAQTGIFALYYNKTLFTRAGLDPAKPPTTWDEWLADSKKIAALGGGISGTPVEAATGLGAAFRVAPFLRQLGGDFMSKDGTKITFNSPANVKALTFLRQLEATAAPGTASILDEGKWFSSWWSNKAGFVVDGPWEMNASTQNKVDWGVAPLPLPTGGHPANVVVGNLMFAVTHLAKQKQAALDFVKLVASQKGATLNFEKTGYQYLPANTKVADAEMANLSGGMTTFIQALKLPGITGLPSYPANPQKVWDEWYNAQLAAIGTTQSIPAVLAKAQSNAEMLITQ